MSDLEVSDKTSVGLPLRNLIGLASAVAVGTWAWFGLQERLNVIETNQIFAKLQVIIETGKAPYDQQQALTLDFFKQRIENLERHVETLKDKTMKASNGVH